MQEFEDTAGMDEQDELFDLDAIMHDFGIVEWKNLGPAEDTHAGNLRLLVEVQGQRYILMERQEGLAGESLRHRYDFRQYLQQQGIPIPSLWVTPQGEPAVALGEDYCELQQWPDGEMFSNADGHLLTRIEQAGTMLGRIHRLSERYAGEQHHWPSEVHMGSMVQGWLNFARARAEQSELSAIETALLNWVEQWEAVLPAAMMAIGSARNLPEWHIHGDYHAHNLRFGPAGIVAVTGWEASRWEKRLFEVAAALFSFSALQWEANRGQTRPLTKRGLEPEKASHFLASYRELCPPVAGEAIHLVDALMLVAPITIINGPLEALFFAEQELETDLVDDLMERLAWATSLPAWLGRVRPMLAEMWS